MSLFILAREFGIQKDEAGKQILDAEKLSKVIDITEEDIRYHYAKARALFNSGELPEIRQLINLYLEKVVVYREHVKVILRMLPVFYARDGGLANKGNGIISL